MVEQGRGDAFGVKHSRDDLAETTIAGHDDRAGIGIDFCIFLFRLDESEHFAARTPFKGRIAHGLYTASLISAVIGTRLPGPGAIYLQQTLNFKAPVRIGDTVIARVEVAELTERGRRARLNCTCEVNGTLVLEGEALVKVPTRAEAETIG